jgi:hypothetical protein
MTALYPSIDDDYCAHPQSHKQRSRKHGEEAVRFDGGKHDPKEQRHNAETPKVAGRKNRPFMCEYRKPTPVSKSQRS